MKRAIVIQQDLNQIHTVEDLTTVFESIASIKIAKIRNRVVVGKEFFAELWQTYRSLRVDPKERLSHRSELKNSRTALLVVTTEGRLSGEVGNKVIDEVITAYQGMQDADIIVLGAYGESRLLQHGVPVKQMYHLPDGEADFDAVEVVSVIEPYEHVTIFYQTYESLRIQRVAKIELVTAMNNLSEAADSDTEPNEVVSSHEFIFEPNINEIADYLESLMIDVTISQVLMESRLAQFAGRFNAMNAAKHRAKDMRTEYDRLYHRAKRAEGDERLKEIINVVTGQVV